MEMMMLYIMLWLGKLSISNVVKVHLSLEFLCILRFCKPVHAVSER